MPENDLRSVTLMALKLGVTAFGGPAAHIAMLRQDVVERRGWLTE
jgi:chromate transporter